MGSIANEGRLRQWLSRFLPPPNSVGNRQSSAATHRILHAGDRTSAFTESGLELREPIGRPLAVVSKDNANNSAVRASFSPASSSKPPTKVELDSLQWGQQLRGPDHDSPTTAADLEGDAGSGTTSPVPAGHGGQALVTVTPSVKHPYMNKWRVASTCVAFFIQGMNDSAPGALLPYMERYYSVSHAIMSLIFVANACGFIAAGPFVHMLNNRFGRAKVLSACTMLNTLAFICLVCRPPFPVVVIAFLCLGFGFATILALDNVFLINLQNGTSLLGYLHGLYGVGGTVAPFVATAMVSNGIRWSSFYFVPLALSLLNTAAFFVAFREYETETASAQLHTALEQTVSRQISRDEKKDILKKAIRNRTTILGALLIFAYQAAEVSISGWVISFLIDYRNGDPAAVGYVTSGFWGGITFGRFVLVAPAHKIGDRISIIILIALTAGFQLMVWLLPNVIGAGVAVAMVGVLLGPIYPCGTGVFSRLLPGHLQITSLGLIGSVGSSGGACGPLIVGAMAQKLGTVVLNPVCIALCVVMQAAWLGLPRVSKRRE